MTPTLSPATFANAQLSLLEAEQNAETAQQTLLLSSSSPSTLASAGLALTNLVLNSQRTGLGGKTVLALEIDSAIVGAKDAAKGGQDGGGSAVEHGIRVGDIVRVGEQPKGGERKAEKKGMEGRGVEGVVTRVRPQGVEVAVGEKEGDEEGLGGKLWV